MKPRLSYRQVTEQLNEGDVVESFEQIEAYPHYMIRSGARFAVVENKLRAAGPLRLKLLHNSDLLAGDLSEWEGCLEFWGPDQDGYSHHAGVADEDIENPGHAGNLDLFPLTVVAV
ncbi:MAG: hypothetical protein DI537_32885 [Stutzerimonas stutzeri]|nr:MAG: hypothetical protein DI537_32885 [Stutzerimonas stutzeri]